MTRDHAIKIESALSYGWRNLKLDLNEVNELQRELSRALEKQVAKKPIYLPKVIFDDEKTVEYCPVCNVQVTHCDYCYRCGQKLDILELLEA